jgi:hypothetical protein
VDIHEEAERFVVLADVPGVEAKDIDITAENGVLTIRGERRTEKKDTDKNGYERIERTSGSFLRRFTLPETPTRKPSRPSRPTACWKSAFPSTRRSSRDASRSKRPNSLPWASSPLASNGRATGHGGPDLSPGAACTRVHLQKCARAGCFQMGPPPDYPQNALLRTASPDPGPL